MKGLLGGIKSVILEYTCTALPRTWVANNQDITLVLSITNTYIYTFMYP